MTTDKKIYISLAISTFFVVIFVAFLIYPNFREIKKSSDDLISQKENLAALEIKAANLKKFETLYQSLEPNLGKIDDLFINPLVPVDFIGFLEKTSENCNLNFFLSLSSSSKTSEEVWPPLIFQMNLVGSFTDFSKFLEKLESAPYLIEIEDVTINRLRGVEAQKEPEKSSSAEIEALVLIKVYTK